MYCSSVHVYILMHLSQDITYVVILFTGHEHRISALQFSSVNPHILWSASQDATIRYVCVCACVRACVHLCMRVCVCLWCVCLCVVC